MFKNSIWIPKIALTTVRGRHAPKRSGSIVKVDVFWMMPYGRELPTSSLTPTRAKATIFAISSIRDS
jgi:hypothetical protein